MINKEVAKRLNLPEEQVNIIIKDFWNAFKYYLYNPDKIRFGIRLRGFLKITLRLDKIEEFAAREVINYRSKYRQNSEYTPEYFQKLLNNLAKYERKTFKKNYPTRNGRLFEDPKAASLLSIEKRSSKWECRASEQESSKAEEGAD